MYGYLQLHNVVSFCIYTIAVTYRVKCCEFALNVQYLVSAVSEWYETQVDYTICYYFCMQYYASKHSFGPVISLRDPEALAINTFNLC